MGFSYEDNCCQSQGIRKSIKDKLLKGIFRVDELFKVAAKCANASYISSVNKGPIRVTFECLFFFQNHVWKLGVRLLHESVQYFKNRYG